MSKDINQHTFLFINIASIIIILAAVKIMEPIIAPFLISIFIAAISAPAMFWLMQKKIPQVLSITIVLSIVFITCVIIFKVIGSSLNLFIADIPLYQNKLHQISLDSIAYMNNWGLNLRVDEINQIFDLGAVMGFVGKTFSGVLNTLTNVFLILLLVVFILIEFASFGKKMRLISANPKKTMKSLHYFSDTLNHYIVLKSLMSLFTAIPICIVLYILEIDYPLLWGFLVFLLNFIPNIGSIIAAVPVVLLAIVQHNFFTAMMVLLLFVAVNNIVGNMIEPKLMGRKLGLSSLIVFLSLVFWGSLLGTVGMFLSVPLTMALKIAMESSEKTQWIAVLLGNDQDELQGT
jgi:AI-2 transport protein TqsA